MKTPKTLAAVASMATVASANWNASAPTAPSGYLPSGSYGIWANATSCNASTLATTVGTTIWSTTTMTKTTIIYEQGSSSEAVPAATIPSTVSPLVSTLSIGYTVFTTVTVPQAAQSAPAGPYSFVVNDGTTSWLNNMTPDSALPITTAVSSIPVVPVPATSSDVTTTLRSTSVITKTTTVTASADSVAQAPLDTFTAPPVTSTTFSYSSELTTTIIDTQYSTVTLSRVSSPTASTDTITDGPDATSTQETQPALVPITTTETELVILNVSSTAATTTLYLTTTIGATITQTITPSALVPASEGSTLLTGEPITLTQTVGSEPVFISTSVNLPGSSAAPDSVPITSTMTAQAPAATSPADLSDTLANPAAAPTSSSSSTTCTNSTMTWTPITLTTFVSGHGSTIVVKSTAVGTTPMSPGFNNTSPATSTILITSFVSGHGTTFAVTTTIPAATGSNSTTTIVGQSSTNTAFAQPAASSPSSSMPSSATSTTGAHTSTATSSSVSRSHTSFQGSTFSSATSDDTSSFPPATRTTSSSSFSNPFPPSSATAIPSAGCGEQGNFTADFDDLPRFTPSKRQQSWNTTMNGTDLGQYPPVTFNGRPYHHLYFSDGYVYAPQKVEPYTPASSPNVAAFANPMRTGWGRNSTGKNNVEPGEFGDSYRDDSPAFWFDANTAYLGCDNPGPDACIIEAMAYAWSGKVDDEVPIAAQNFTIPPCSNNCRMVEVAFPTSFKSLSGLQFRAIVDNEPRTFYVDDLNMRWTNSSCSAGMMRQESR